MKSPINILKANRDKLLKQKEDITKELTKLEELENASDLGDNLSEPEFETRVEDIRDLNTLEAFKDTLRRSLSEVKIALKRIKKNNYGICVNCRKQISAERLEAFPQAQYCKECAALMEEKENGKAG